MVIILEGVNKTGKTTFSKLLQEKGFKYFKNKSVEFILQSNKIDKYSFFNGELLGMANMLKYMNENIVIDRFHFTEFAYGFVDRNYLSDYVMHIDKMLNAIGVKLIYMDDKIEFINERVGRDLSVYKLAMELIYNVSSIDKIKHSLYGPTEKLFEWIGL